MDDPRIQEIVNTLSDSTAKESAKVHLEWAEQAGVRIVANRDGFIRLAIECLSAAVASLKPGFDTVQSDWKYLFVKGSSTVSRVSRTDNVELPARPKPTRLEKAKSTFAAVVVIAVLLFLLASVLVGCFTIVDKLIH